LKFLLYIYIYIWMLVFRNLFMYYWCLFSAFSPFFVFPYQAFLTEEKVCCSNICFRITCFSFSFYLIMIATWTLFIIFATHSFLISLVYIDLHEDSSQKFFLWGVFRPKKPSLWQLMLFLEKNKASRRP
jgi:hypothetical protein